VSNLETAIECAHALARAKGLRHIPAPHGVWGRVKVCDFFEQELRVRAQSLDGTEKAQLARTLKLLNLEVRGL
jgi:hypothetical protein